MDIKQIVNSKGGKVAAAAAAAANGAAQDLQLLHPIQQVNGMTAMSDTGSERGISPHDSERSHYSGPRYGPPMTNMNGAPNMMRYPSPTAMQNPMPMMQQPYQPNQNFENPIMQPEPARPARQTATDGAPKAFPCSSCGKGFARRSDLARHGMFDMRIWNYSLLIPHRTYPYRRATSRLRTPWLRKAIHPTFGSHSSQQSAHGRKATYVRTLRKGKYISKFIFGHGLTSFLAIQ